MCRGLVRLIVHLSGRGCFYFFTSSIGDAAHFTYYLDSQITGCGVRINLNAAICPAPDISCRHHLIFLECVVTPIAELNSRVKWCYTL